MAVDQTNIQRRRVITAALLGAFGAASRNVFAQGSKKVGTIIVPFAAGGARELPARVVQEDMSKALGQTWIIDNKPGAGGAIGTSYVAKQPADGLTLLMAASSHFVTAATGARPAYEPVKDFAPVALIGTQSYVAIVQAAMPVKNVAELIAYAKSRPAGELNYGSAGIASSTHLAAAYLCSMAGIQMTHIPFKGTSEAANDVVGGRSHLVFVPTAGAGVYLSDKRVRVIGISSKKRSSTMPDVPTIADSGLPGYQFESWFGLLAPAKTPAATIEEINKAVNTALSHPDVKKRLDSLGIDENPMSVADFNKLFLADRDLMAKTVKDSGLTRE